MTIANKYIQQCKSLFPVYGKLERTFLNRLKVQVNEHLDLFPDISYNELVKQFGSPREVVMEYYDNIEDDYLLSKIDLAKKVKKFLLFIAIYWQKKPTGGTACPEDHGGKGLTAGKVHGVI